MREEKTVHIQDYMEIPIRLHMDGWFNADIDGATIRYETIAEMHSRIEKYWSAKKRLARRSVAVKCIDDNLQETTITGVHAGNGSLLISPKIEDPTYGGSPSRLYLDCPLSRRLVETIQSAKRGIEEAEARLKNLQIEVERRFRRRLSEPDYDQIVTSIEKQAERAKKYAEKKGSRDE